MKGYKVFNSDMSCNNFEFAVGNIYEIEGKLEICKNGFHFCNELKNCYDYYDFNYKNPVCEIEALGDVITENDKSCTSKIKIVRKLELEEILCFLNLFCSSNTGSWNKGLWNKGSGNTGSWNTGSDNTGPRNTGSWNTGSGNTGSGNTGSWNTGSWNTGSENTGSKNKGSGNFGSRSVGFFNTKSFVGTVENCCCFDEETGFSFETFQEKYSGIINEIENRNFRNVSKLANYTEKKWDKIRNYL